MQTNVITQPHLFNFVLGCLSSHSQRPPEQRLLLPSWPHRRQRQRLELLHWRLGSSCAAHLLLPGSRQQSGREEAGSCSCSCSCRQGRLGRQSRRAHSAPALLPQQLPLLGGALQSRVCSCAQLRQEARGAQRGRGRGRGGAACSPPLLCLSQHCRAAVAPTGCSGH